MGRDIMFQSKEDKQASDKQRQEEGILGKETKASSL